MTTNNIRTTASPEAMAEALQAYFTAWKSWAEAASGKQGLEILAQLKPTNFGWKVASIEDFGEALAVWLPLSSQLHVSTVDGRKLALIVPSSPIAGVSIIELMQRRQTWP